jgi:hypothetical protein
MGWIDPENPLYATPAGSLKDKPDIQDRLQALDEMERVAALFKTYPEMDPPASFVELVKELLDSGKYGSPVEST